MFRNLPHKRLYPTLSFDLKVQVRVEIIALGLNDVCEQGYYVEYIISFYQAI